VLHARGDIPGWDEDRVYEVADALLHGEQAPEPDPDELPATGARLRWIPAQGPSAAPAQGLERAELMVDGDIVGSVEVGWEVDPFAVPLLQIAHRTGARVVLRHVAGTEDLAASVAASHPPGTPLLNLVRELRTDRGPVLLITALHRDFASTDTLAALAIADVAVALDDPQAATPWTADIITGTDLAAAVRILSALPVARRTTQSSVNLAKGGTTLAGLLLVTGEPSRPSNPLSLRRWLNPVNAAAASALASGAYSASKVLRQPDPTPQPLTAWHALDPEIVYSRLAGRTQPLAAEVGEPAWRRVLEDLYYEPLMAPLRRPLNQMGRLLDATRHELADPLTPILAVGAAASAIVGSNVDALLVAGVMTVNALTGGAQRLRADAAAAELFAEQDQVARRVVVPVVATTRRRLEAARHAERTVTVAASSLRPGDVIDLSAPDVVPADARLLVAEDLEVDESLLTGESLPVDKQVDPVAAGDPDRASMLFEGSTIVAGHARAIVVATGVGTAAHRAISAVIDVESSAGVQARLRELTAKVLPLTLAGGAAVTGLALLRRASLRQAVADGVAIAVAAVPEGLPLVATLSQLAAAQRLSARGVLVRAPRTIEALGRVDTVCFDKTGTLTENRLRVVRSVPAATNPRGPFPDATDPQAAHILLAAARASTQPHEGQGHAHATDEAILKSAESLAGESDSEWNLIAEVPFESSRGFAAAIGTLSTDPTTPLLMLKGAPEVVLPRCRFADPEADQDHAESLVHNLAEQGLRVLAVAKRSWVHETEDDDDTDADAVDAAAYDLELIGYVGLADTARPSARPLIEALVDADRNVVLITGDHPVTARAIARQLGLPEDARVITGAELNGLDEDACAKLAADVQVFARVSPEQKVQIVGALQRCGRVTAMVGDGANDAAAIRMADVGIGVSGRGSSAARGAADIVLTEDDLGVLLDALVEGRGMWAGVRDAVTILVGGNVGEVLFTIIGTAFGSGRAPVGTRQLLLVNLLTDMFPALAVAVTPQFDEPEADEYDTAEEADEARRAYQRSVLTAPTPSLDAPLMRQIVTRGAVTAAGATAAWAIGRWTPGTERRTATMGLTALVTTQLAQTLLARRHSPLVVATALGSSAVLVAIVQTPGVSHFFGCTPLGPVAWTGVAGATAAATGLSVLAPNWLAKTTGIAEADEA
ncbi:cation-translocating P-type ATPase, partial [Mycobacterium sp.]|uniref:cation-translocating P-type ATPase n=1 Tax=Mycobacterium sp. TaxID=1785 RepID=UPI003C72692D